MIRDEVHELKVALARMGGILTDDEPNRDQLDEILSALFSIVKEGADFAGIPKEERAKAIAHAFVGAGADIFEAAVMYSDEQGESVE